MSTVKKMVPTREIEINDRSKLSDASVHLFQTRTIFFAFRQSFHHGVKQQQKSKKKKQK